MSWISLWVVLRTTYSPNETFSHLGVAEMSGRAATAVLKMQVADICWECIKRLVESLGMSNPIHSSINAPEETRGNITALERLAPPWTRCCLLPRPRQKFKDSYTWPDSTEHSPDPPPPLHHIKILYTQQCFLFFSFNYSVFDAIFSSLGACVKQVKQWWTWLRAWGQPSLLCQVGQDNTGKNVPRNSGQFRSTVRGHTFLSLRGTKTVILNLKVAALIEYINLTTDVIDQKSQFQFYYCVRG